MNRKAHRAFMAILAPAMNTLKATLVDLRAQGVDEAAIALLIEAAAEPLRGNSDQATFEAIVKEIRETARPPHEGPTALQ